MTLYVDSSALLKRYVDEHDSQTAVEFMATDPVLATSLDGELVVNSAPGHGTTLRMVVPG